MEIKALVVGLLPLNEVIIYSLPEGLWVFCITVTSRSFYIQWQNARIDLDIIPLVHTIGLEFAQLSGVARGRFDRMDVALIVVFWFAARLGFQKCGQKQNLLAHVNSQTIACFASYGVVYLSHVFE